MKKIVRKTCLLSLVCVLLFAFVFSATSCSSSYNEGYNKLYDYVKENNKSDTDGVIQYSKVVEKTHYIFTASKKKGSGIGVCVCDSGGDIGEIQFDIEKEGLSDDNFFSVTITTKKIGDYYYQGTTLLRSTDQTSFTIIYEKQSRISYGGWVDVSESIVSALDTRLKLIVQLRLLELYDFIKNDIGIPMELFAAK